MPSQKDKDKYEHVHLHHVHLHHDHRDHRGSHRRCWNESIKTPLSARVPAQHCVQSNRMNWGSGLTFGIVAGDLTLVQPIKLGRPRQAYLLNKLVLSGKKKRHRMSTLEP